jgi:Fic family protein
MRSFSNVDITFAGQPRELGPLLARIDTGRGREQLFQNQVPEVLRHLSQSARIASITASNAIEGVIVETERAIKIAEGAPRFRNRNEKEFAGYRDAIDSVMRFARYEPVSIPFVLYLHRQIFQHAGGRGGYLKTDPNYIVSYESGVREVVYAPPAPEETEFLLRELFERYRLAQQDQLAHPLVLIAALVLDFLAIHPVADGNGRLARLLTTYELLAHGYGVAKYVSLEQRIYDSKNSYYQRLFESQQGWHTSEHTIWPWVSYLASILSVAYDDFEASVASARDSVGNKQERVRRYILEQAPSEFRRRDIERAMPGVSVATIRLVLNELRDEGQISVNGGGPGARWRRN